MKIIEGKVSDLGPVMRQLLTEVTTVRRRVLEDFEERMVLHCLQECLHPNGAGEVPIPFTKADSDACELGHPTLLGTKIGKIGDEEFRQVCVEILGLHVRESIEFYNGAAVYTFLNKCLLKKKARKRPKMWP